MDIGVLKSFKDELSVKLEDSSFIASFLSDQADSASTAWSKGPSVSLVPLELEMSGITPSELKYKEPAVKRYAHGHCYRDGRLSRIDVYNSKGEICEWEYFGYAENRAYSLKINRHNEIGWIKSVDYELGYVVRACRLDFDSEFWTFGYEWKDGRLQEIMTFSSNSLPGTRIYPTFKSNGVVDTLYFLKSGKKFNIYSR